MKDLRAKAERAKVIRHAVPGGGRRIQSLRAFRRAVLFSFFAWRLVGLLSLRLFVFWFDREGFVRTFRELVLGSLGFHFGSSGGSWAPFSGLWAPLGIHFGGP